MSSPLLVVQQGGKQHRQWKMLGLIYAVGAVILVPLVLEPFELGKMNRALVYSVAVLAVNMVVGFNGLLALGHSAFMGVGAFVTASLVQDEGLDYWQIIPIVVIAGFLVGIVVGLPALRVRGLYLALVTIAQAAVFPTLVNIDELGIARRTGGPNGRKVDEVVDRTETSLFEWLPGVDGARGDSAYRYWILVVMTGIVILLVRNIVRSRPGRAILAIRDNEAGAAVYGVHLPIYRTVNFALSSAVGSLAGLMWCLDKGFVAGQDFTFLLAVDLIIGLVIGGVGTLQGSILGGMFVVWVRDLTKRISIPLFGLYELDGDGPLSAAIFGLILILFTFFAPGGLASLLRLVNNMIIRVVPNKPDGDPIVPIDSTDPGPESTRASTAMMLAIIGPVALIAGWVLMLVDHLIVGVLAFGLRASIVFLAPIALIVGANEMRAAAAGKRGDNGPSAYAQGRIAAFLGLFSLTYIGAFLLNVALASHHGGHLTRVWAAARPDQQLIAHDIQPQFWLFGYKNGTNYGDFAPLDVVLQPAVAVVLTVLAIAGFLLAGWWFFLRDVGTAADAAAADGDDGEPQLAQVASEAPAAEVAEENAPAGGLDSGEAGADE